MMTNAAKNISSVEPSPPSGEMPNSLSIKSMVLVLWFRLDRDRPCAPIPRAADEFAILRVQQEVGRHGIWQAAREGCPVNPLIQRLINADIAGDPYPLEVCRIDHDRIHGNVREPCGAIHPTDAGVLRPENQACRAGNARIRHPVARGVARIDGDAADIFGGRRSEEDTSELHS